MALNPEAWRSIKTIGKTARTLVMSANDDDIVDVMGEIREAEKALYNERHLAMAEISKGQEGHDWYVVQPRKCTRSYNDSSLLTKFADVLDLSLIATIGYLVNNRILVLEWRWTNLRNAIRDLGIDVKIAQREIIAGENADIGESWGDGYASFEKIADRKGK